MLLIKSSISDSLKRMCFPSFASFKCGRMLSLKNFLFTFSKFKLSLSDISLGSGTGPPPFGNVSNF